MSLCPYCTRYLPTITTICPHCGKKLIKEDIDPSEYMMDRISFIYDEIRECTVKGTFIGLLLRKDGKYGFLSKITRGLPCEYDYICPHLNYSTLPNCKAYGSTVVYDVRKDGGCGIISFCPADPFFNRDTGSVFRSVEYIDNYPACFVVTKKADPENLFFYNINICRNIIDTPFKYVERVYKRNDPYRNGVFFACNTLKDPRGFFRIIDIVTRETVAIEYYDLFEDNNPNWTRRKL